LYTEVGVFRTAVEVGSLVLPVCGIISEINLAMMRIQLLTSAVIDLFVTSEIRRAAKTAFEYTARRSGPYSPPYLGSGLLFGALTFDLAMVWFSFGTRCLITIIKVSISHDKWTTSTALLQRRRSICRAVRRCKHSPLLSSHEFSRPSVITFRCFDIGERFVFL